MTLGLLMVVVLLATLTQTVTGFGSTLVIVTLGSYLLDRQALLATVVPLGLLQTAFVLRKDRAHVAKDLLTKQLLPWMGAGLLVGYGAAQWLANGPLGGHLLINLFGALVAVLAVIELRKLLGSRATQVAPDERTHTERTHLEQTASAPSMAHISRFWLSISGILHGMYATGGPTLVYALGRSGLDRKAFRSTLAVVWFVLDGVLTVLFLVDGEITGERALSAVGLLPAMAGGVFLGQWVHARVKERTFRVALFGLLVLAGGALALRG